MGEDREWEGKGRGKRKEGRKRKKRKEGKEGEAEHPEKLSKVGAYDVIISYHIKSNQIKSNLFAVVKMHNKQFIKITFHLAGQTGDSFALMSAHKN